MPREVSFSVLLDLPAALYWSLRNDRKYDEFCAAEHGAKYVLHSSGETGTGERCFVEASYQYKTFSAVKQLLGRDGVCVWSRMEVRLACSLNSRRAKLTHLLPADWFPRGETTWIARIRAVSSATV